MQIGNAVPPLLSRAIAIAFLKSLGREVRTEDPFAMCRFSVRLPNIKSASQLQLVSAPEDCPRDEAPSDSDSDDDV